MSTTKKYYTFYDVTLALRKILGKQALQQQTGAVLWLSMCRRSVCTGRCSAGTLRACGQPAEPPVHLPAADAVPGVA